MARVLVVDDDPDLREIVSLLLEEAGHAVRIACDGREALRILHASRSAWVVLLDVQMPVMDGWAVLRAVQQDDPASQRHAFVLMTAGYRALAFDLARMGAQWPIPIPTLTKPFDIADMLTAVEQAAQRLRTPASAGRNRHADQAG